VNHITWHFPNFMTRSKKHDKEEKNFQKNIKILTNDFTNVF